MRAMLSDAKATALGRCSGSRPSSAVTVSRCIPRIRSRHRVTAHAATRASLVVTEQFRGGTEHSITDAPAGGPAGVLQQLLKGPFLYNTPEELSAAEPMLHNMFEFKHRAAAHQQSQEAVEHYCRMMKTFVASVEPQMDSTPSPGKSDTTQKPPLQALWSSLTPSDVQALSAAADILVSDSIAWYPEFGCALVALESPQSGDPGIGLSVRLGELSLQLVCLDSWDFYTHSSHTGTYNTSAPRSHKVIFAGSISSDSHASLLCKIDSLIQQRLQAKKKGQGTAGFARTPDFLHAVVQDALTAVSTGASLEGGTPEQQADSGTPPKGGFTDVGRHTGSVARDTSWHLVRQTFLALLQMADGCSGCPDPLLLFRYTMMYLGLWLLLGLMPHITPDTADGTAINMCMVMLQSVATAAAALSAEKHDVTALQVVVQAIRQHLEAIVEQRQLAIAQQQALPAAEVTGTMLGKWTEPTGIVPAAVPVSSGEEGLEAARQRAARNLGSLPLVPAGQSLAVVLGQLLQRLQDAAANPSDDVKMQHALRSVEDELFSRAVLGISGHKEYASLAPGTVEQLWQVVDGYRECLVKFKACATGQAHFQADLRGREVLLVWVAYCINFEVCRQHTVVGQYGVALQPEDLRHLSLSDRLATDAALAVAAYLKQCTVAGRPLFSLRASGAATFHMAEQYARKDRQMCSILQQEQAAAVARISKHYQQVRAQQEEARQLRTQLEQLRSDVAYYQAQRDRWNYGSRDWKYHNGKITTLNADISTATAKLAAAEKPPQPVVQPLPEQQGLALQWLFFLYQPPLLRQLSRGSFLAEQLLLPLPLGSYPEVVQQLAVGGYDTSLVEHYNRCNMDSTWFQPPNPVRSGSDGRVMLWSTSKMPELKDIGPGHIDSYSHDRVGVYYPDNLLPGMTWQGSGCSADAAVGLSMSGFFNPFKSVKKSLVLDSFTEKLQQEDAMLQWSMAQPYSRSNVPAARGNIGVAQQDKESKPDWLSKLSYLKLTALRSYPLQQLHRLCDLLSECRDMPYSQHSVQAMIRQTLYHLGPLVEFTGKDSSSSSNTQLTQQWRTNWAAAGGVLDTLCFELQKLADELSEKPRAHDAVLLLGEVAAYLSDWHAPCKAVARQFANMCSRYADSQLQEEVDKAARAAEEAVHAQMLGKQCKARMLALLCYAAGPLETQDISHMVRLMVQIKHGDVYLGQVPELQQQLAQLRVLCHNTMCRRLRDIHSRIEHTTLTAAASSVLQTVPTGLAWRAVASSGRTMASYEAVGQDASGRQHLYSVNILDGTVLLDGFPPGRLPREITSHPLYIRTFGSVDFEVFKTDQGVLVTNRSVNGRYYQFYLAAAAAGDAQPAGDLVITEVDGQNKEQLQLLDAGVDSSCGAWGQQLPVRLRELYSHWLSRKHNVILLRPHAFYKHNCCFIIQHPAAEQLSSSACRYQCWPVPYHLQQEHWLDLLGSHKPTLQQQKLVLEQQASHVLQVLSKFEDKQFIHAYSCSSCQPSTGPQATTSSALMLFDMPRFGVGFELHSNGTLVSRDFKGYCLHESQQLVEQLPDGAVDYTLPDFRQYLVLQRCPQLSSGAIPGSGRADVLVVVPAGEVQPSWSGAGGTTVATDASSGAKLQYHTYEVHGRFGYLQASSIVSRLQLAALYAATSTLLPEPASQHTGAETAMQLVRQSWTNQPLSSAELQQLQSTSNLGGHLAPALRLLAYELEASSVQLQHLHAHKTAMGAAAASLEFANAAPSAAGSSKEAAPPKLDAAAASDYQQLVAKLQPGAWGLNSRQLLTPLEDQRIFHTGSRGMNRSAQTTPKWLRQHGTKLSDIPPCPVGTCFVSDTEAELVKLVVQPIPRTPPPAYPLSYTANDSVPLRQEMHKELQASWEAHHKSPEATELVPGAELMVRQLQADVQRQREIAQAYALDHMFNIPKQDSQAGSCFSFLRTAGVSAEASVRDLLRCAFQPTLIKEFNPFLSEKARGALHQGALIWAQLCVLEDRLARLVKLFENNQETYKPVIVRELLVQRNWDPVQHPKWLVFEVEGQLQIRPDQYHHAKELLNHPHNSTEPGPITQLNMGEGKTRVIIPMLAMEWADQSCVVRVNFLSPLLAMSYQHLHDTLTASVLNMKLFTMPFHRDVEVTAQGAHAMLGALTYCQKAGGLLLVAPEHRLSLLLKSMELWAKSQYALYGQLQHLLAMPYQDILDESDELLHHRLQLVYACGTHQSLPALQERTIAIEALLRVLSDMVDAGTCPQLAADGVAAWTPKHNRPPGSFCGIQLLPGRPLENVIKPLQLCLAEALIKHHPHEMRWLGNLGAAKAQFLSFVTEPAVSAQKLLENATSLLSKVVQGQQDVADQMLALRGLLACRILQHDLQKRHRVQFGVSRLQTARKRLAVPFRAADTPSTRSEYSHPDVALLLTHLSYYDDGLSLKEFKDAVDQLLLMGPSAQEDHYNQWLQLSADRITPEDRPMFDEVCKVDPSNTQQLQLMHGYLSHNMAVVNFWLYYCVLPKETSQYPKRLVATSWNLADNVDGRVVGFSGTNDNHRLLPLQVQQRALVAQPHLVGTNGKMLAMLLNLATYKTLKRSSAAKQDNFKPVWKTLLDAALQHPGSNGQRGVEALLDCGALLAGVDTSAAAKYILQHMPPGRYKGVCYYEASSKQWTVRDTVGRVVPLQQSPLAESECFVIYDDARCRGADLKLNQQAVGLLTLAAGICKDKTMQAAGRLRQLGRGQTVIVTGLPDVTEKIFDAAGTGADVRNSSEPSMQHVLQWVMDNTVQDTLHGVVEHATQGMLFAVTKNAPKRCMLDEKLLLSEFYGSSTAPEPVDRVLQAAATKARLQLQLPINGTTGAAGSNSKVSRRLSISDAGRLDIIQQVLRSGTAHGQGHLVVAGQAADEECERELEQEEEEEREEEIEVPKVTAAAEVDWQYSTVFAAASVGDLISKGSCSVRTLPAAADSLGSSLAAFAWSPRVYCTANFLDTIVPPAMGSTSDGLGPYQRYVNAMLLFASGEVLLLSEREAEGLQELAWGIAQPPPQTCQHPPLLLSLCYARKALADNSGSRMLLAQLLTPSQAATGGSYSSSAPEASQLQLSAMLQQRLSAQELVHTRLFNGAASYDGQQQKQLLHKLVQGKREEAMGLLALREQLTMFARSDLEKACDF